MIPVLFLVLVSLSAGAAVFFIFFAVLPRPSVVPEQKTTGTRISLNLRYMKERLRGFDRLLSQDHRSRPARRVRCVAGIAIAVMVFIAGGNLFFALMAGAGTYAVIGWRYGRKKEKACREFDDQLIEALGMIATAVRSGQSLLQALENMVKESRPPLAPLFAEALARTRLGIPLSESLDDLTGKAGSNELRIAVNAILLARETGGNLGEIMLSIAETMRVRKKIKGKIETLTAQGKASGIIMSLVPVMLLILLTLIEPKLYGLLFSTLAGNIMLCIAFLMIACGAFFIKKITSIDF